MHTDSDMSMFSWSYWASGQTILDHARKIMKLTDSVDKPSEEEGISHVKEALVINNTKNNLESPPCLACANTHL